jgi:hypothetical protein
LIGPHGTEIQPPEFPRRHFETILIIEGGPPVPWTKPQDIPFDPDAPLPRIDPLFHDIIRPGLGDGSVRYIRKDNRETTLCAAITRNGVETPGPDW